MRVVERFQEYKAVLIVRPDKTLAGIFTPADIAAEFGALAAPFLLIGQIEEQLPWLVQKSLPDLTGALAVGGTILGRAPPPWVSDLTMGELHRILDHDQNWTKVGIGFDGAEFCMATRPTSRDHAVQLMLSPKAGRMRHLPVLTVEP